MSEPDTLQADVPDDVQDALDRVAGELRRAKRVLFITGAGISADSGLPTYRGVGGLYNDGRTEEGYTIENCLSSSMFGLRPELTWKYMLVVGKAVAAHRPNRAHEVIARLERDFHDRGGKVVVLTQNIDGYHGAAGSKNVLEIHGNMREMFCTACDWTDFVDPTGKGVEGGDETDPFRRRLEELERSLPPRCPECGGVIRPRIVLFEEMLPRDVLRTFENEFCDGYGFDMVFSVGTSAMFPYIIAPVLMAGSCGKTTVEINPGRTELAERVSVYLPLGAARAFEELEKRYAKTES